jgi:hypothetical protein
MNALESDDKDRKMEHIVDQLLITVEEGEENLLSRFSKMVYNTESKTPVILKIIFIFHV